MEQKIISLGKGIHRTPSMGDNGELTECVNLYGVDGEMRVLPTLSEVDGVTIKSDTVLRYVHKSNGFVHYISTDEDGKELYCMDDEDNPILVLGENEVIKNIMSIGNVLVVSTSERMYKLLWTDSGYVDYNLDDIEDLEVEFSLSGDYERTNTRLFGVKQTMYSSDEYDQLVATVTVSGKDMNKQCTLVNIKTEAGMLQKGHYYQISGIDSKSNYFVYALFGADEDLDLNTLTFKNDYEGDETIDIIAYDGSLKWWGQEGPIIYKNSSNPKFDKLAMAHNGVTCTFTCQKDYKKVFMVISSSAYRSESYRICEKRESTSMYKFTIDKEDDTNINVILGAINKFVKEKSTDANRFMYPFFVKAAVKLVDGTYVKQTPPVLMVPNSGAMPNCYITESISNTNQAFGLVSAVCCDLEYKVRSSEVLNMLKGRSKIVESIAIAVSEPIVTMNQAMSNNDLKEYFYLDSDGMDPTDENFEGYYGDSVTNARIENINSISGYKRVTKENMDKALNIKPLYQVTLPKEDNVRQKIIDTSKFYVVKEIPINEVEAGSIKKVNMEKDTLNGLLGRQEMAEEVNSHKVYNAETLYTYNNRLNLANVTEQMFVGFNPYLMTGTCHEGGYNWDGRGYAVVTLSKENKQYTAVREYTFDSLAQAIWFFYPDVNAKSVTLYTKAELRGGHTTAYTQKTYQLTKHPFLNGAYYLGSIDGVIGEADEESVETEEIKSIFEQYTQSVRPVITTTNKVVSTLVNNPFVMDSNDTYIGVGEIWKITSNAKALSQGQFGQHPLIAFCSDGVWAISVGSGNFDAVQAISRDIVNNVPAITQTDGEIVFTTDRGLCVLSGSQIDILDLQMDGKDAFDMTVLDTNTNNNYDVPFVDILKSCMTDYDYVHGLVWIYPRLDEVYNNKVYVLNVRDREIYSSLLSETHFIRTIVHDYPYSLIHVKGSKVIAGEPDIVFDQISTYKREDGITNGWLLTRPIAFDNPSALKKLVDARLEKTKMDASSRYAVRVFVSNDRTKWFEMTSLRSRSYKWYRFAIYCDMMKDDRLTGIVCQTEETRTNKLR